MFQTHRPTEGRGELSQLLDSFWIRCAGRSAQGRRTVAGARVKATQRQALLNYSLSQVVSSFLIWLVRSTSFVAPGQPNKSQLIDADRFVLSANTAGVSYLWTTICTLGTRGHAHCDNSCAEHRVQCSWVRTPRSLAHFLGTIGRVEPRPTAWGTVSPSRDTTPSSSRCYPTDLIFYELETVHCHKSVVVHRSTLTSRSKLETDEEVS